MLFCPVPFFSSPPEDEYVYHQEYLSINQGALETVEDPASPPIKMNSTEEAPSTVQTEAETPEAVTPESMTPAASTDDADPETVKRLFEESTEDTPIEEEALEEAPIKTEDTPIEEEALEEAPIKTEPKKEDVVVTVESSVPFTQSLEIGEEKEIGKKKEIGKEQEIEKEKKKEQEIEIKKDTYDQASISPLKFIVLAMLLSVVAKYIVLQGGSSQLAPSLQETVVLKEAVVDLINQVREETDEEASIPVEKAEEDPVTDDIGEETVEEAPIPVEEAEEDPVTEDIGEETVEEASIPVEEAEEDSVTEDIGEETVEEAPIPVEEAEEDPVTEDMGEETVEEAADEPEPDEAEEHEEL